MKETDYSSGMKLSASHNNNPGIGKDINSAGSVIFLGGYDFGGCTCTIESDEDTDPMILTLMVMISVTEWN